MTDDDRVRLARRVPDVSAAPLHLKTPGRIMAKLP